MKMLFRALAIVCLFASVSTAQVLLKQSTATTQNCHFTKIADGTDGTGITVTNITLKIIAQSATTSATVDAAPTCAASGSANDCVEKTSGGGYYNYELSAANTGTLGTLDVECISTGYYSDPVRFQVVSSGYWDLVNTGPSTAPSNFALLSIDGNGRLDIIKVAGTTQTAGDIPARLPAALTAGGFMKSDEQAINAVSTSSVTAVNANQGTTQPINFTGTGASALAKGDLVDIAGAAVNTATAQIGSNLVSTAANAITSTSIQDGAVTTAKLGANAVNAAKLDPDVTTEIQTGLLTVPKNTAISAFPIKAKTSAGVAVTGATPACSISRDGAARSATGISNNNEVGLGTYTINFTGAAINGTNNWLYCTFSGGSGTAVPYEQFIFTQR